MRAPPQEVCGVARARVDQGERDQGGQCASTPWLSLFPYLPHTASGDYSITQDTIMSNVMLMRQSISEAKRL